MTRPLPWLYLYAAEPGGLRRRREVLRPVVTVSIPGQLSSMEPSWALVDTGAEDIFAADWLADFAGVDAAGSEDRLLVGIGGQVVEVAFVEVELRLHAPHEPDEVITCAPTSDSSPSGRHRSPSCSAKSASSIGSPSPSTVAPPRSP